ncbi:transcriptional repressor LexA [Catellatospora citrea]|uniref:LexA repressor n=1 Tax=Catellatospora citrea TaxID=53366 RepID=A0A8J3K8V3_9ACTN|nr:transcriptional repressor LexA [Catellatospora citrea]RKE06616.1 SOS-response transcriptional repressor LexA [Catellatospora citrea]GIF98612.1 LexA repressor [Catellatospora citrea]
MHSKLSERQRRILAVIQDGVTSRGYPPTLREIGRAVGLAASSSVAYHLRELEEKGLLQRDRGRPRALSVRLPLDDDGIPQQRTAATVQVPLLGTIAAGGPILAEESLEETLTLSRDLVGHGTLFSLRVRGDSMVDAAICDGDVVVIRRQPTAYSGEIVAAMIDGEATVKVYRVSRGHVELVPCNPAYDPIPGDDAVVLGKVVAVVRRVR